jgi:hypothetical protein
MRFGKADRSYDPETSIEQFKTTVFVVLFWLPLIPTGTFLVERDSAFLRNQMIVLKRLPLDCEQVLKVWVVTAGTLLAVIWAFKCCLAYSSEDEPSAMSSLREQEALR